MEYTIKALAKLAGVSTRTLRYYDEIGLLKPCRINSSGYRIYGQEEVDLLQQILFYREMDMKLEEIRKIISQKGFNIDKALENHYSQLIAKRQQIDQLIATIEKTIDTRKGERSMSDKEKFEGFKKEAMKQNEESYGKEIREAYGDEVVNASNKKFMNMTEEDYTKMQQVEEELFESLKEVIKTKDLSSMEAKNAFEKHKEWLGFTWNFYSKEAHVGLASMYVEDERFTKYYDEKLGEGATKMLWEIINKYAL